MRYLIGFLIFTSALVHADGPHYNHKNNFVQLEFDNVYADIKSAKTQIPKAASLTKSQLSTLVPVVTGLLYYCSDCTSQSLCVSTGTSTGQLSGSSSRTAACN